MNIKKLSGWMRVWIVLSVLFFLCMSWYGLGERADENMRTYNIYLNMCQRDHSISNPQTITCYEYAQTQLNEDGTSSTLVYILFFSVLPLTLIWLVGFLSLKVFRWIKKGFNENS